MGSTRKLVLVFVVLAVVGLPLAYFFAGPIDFWFLTGVVTLSTIYWFGAALAQIVQTGRFGSRMTLDEIRLEGDPVRMARLLRYHLGWSPGKIAAEMNRWGITNGGLPWRENDVRRVVKRANRVF